MRSTFPLLFALALFALPSLTSGQFTTPPGFLSKEGMAWQNLSSTNGSTILFGYHPSSRYQVVDGEIKAKGNQTLKSVGYRLDHHRHTTSTAAGRGWSSVRLTLSAGDHTRMSQSFSRNVLSTPTLVFSGTVAWPEVTGTPLTKPAPWSSSYAFPFGTGGSTSQYLYDAKRDLCLDYTFAGGRLMNRRLSWSNPVGRPYQLDGLHTRIHAAFGADRFFRIGTGSGSCTDSSSTRIPIGWVGTDLWGPASTSNPAWRGKAVANLVCSDAAPNSFVVHAVGLNGSTTGTPIPSFGCYNLMVDLAQVQLISVLPTDAIGWSTTRFVPIGDLTTLAPLGKSVSFWSQAAWNDSKTGQVKLTVATRCTPDFSLKLNSTAPKKRLVYQYGGSRDVWGPQVETSITRFH